MEQHFPVLNQCKLFEGISPDDLSGMLACLGAQIRSFARNETIFQEGSAAVHVGIVLSGSVQIAKDDFYGNRSIVATVHPGQLFGEAFACAGAAVMPVNAIAMEKCEIMLIDCRRLLRSCSNACSFHSRLIMNLMQVMANKNLMLNQKIDVLSKRTTRDKLMAYLMDHAKRSQTSEFTIPLDRQGLADYLGVERSALSAEISKLRKEGILESDRSRFRLVRPE